MPPRLKISRRRVRRFRAALLGWFEIARREFPWRHAEATEYERIVSEVLLQRTRAEAVGTHFGAFVREYPSWASLAAAPRARLEESLRPLGLWKRRAASLGQMAAAVELLGPGWPRKREELQAIPAVGQYVASAIMLFVHDQPEPLLDTNMARVLERYFQPRVLADIRHDPILQELSRAILAEGEAREVNWACLDLAAMICRPRRPACEICPMRRGCAFAVRARLRPIGK